MVSVRQLGALKPPSLQGKCQSRRLGPHSKLSPLNLIEFAGVTIQSGQVSRTKERNTPGLINQAPSPRPRALAGEDPLDPEPPLARASPPQPAASLRRWKISQWARFRTFCF